MKDNQTADDIKYMKLALDLAKKGMGWTSPNPMVGAVIVKDGQIIGKGWHERYGQKHAERNALENCICDPKGSTMYVTLEPCCHHGKQPPCTEAILKSQIRRVVIGSYDPNPLVSGKGIWFLKENGIQITEHVMEPECNKLNEVFFHYITTKKPFVVMKYAMTMDGKIATHTGQSQWITGEAARAHVHLQRHRYSAIMVGVGTVLADDPLLTCRMKNGRNPIRIICDTNLRTPLDSQIVTTARQVPTILATCASDTSAIMSYEKAGCHVINVNDKNSHVDLNELMEKLGSRQIDSILLEGGGSLNWSAVESGIVQKVQTYIAPKIFGGNDAKTPVSGLGIDFPANAFMLKNSVITRLGDDFLIESEVENRVYRNS